MEFVATCLFGVERMLADEIDALGYERTETSDGRITFEADADAIARGNLWLRTAERLYMKAGAFSADTSDGLFEGTKALPWEQWLDRDACFPVTGHSLKSALFSVPDCQAIIKKAIVERLKQKYGLNWFGETGAKYRVEFFIFHDKVTLMIDTSGTPLHKRGYRLASNDAPLRETLAAALVKLSRPREGVLFRDPFCGSGTIPIEAALIMTNTAPGLNRSFAAEDFCFVDKRVFAQAREEAREARVPAAGFEAYASDIDPKFVSITKGNIRRAGVGSHVKAFVADALDISSGGRRGTVVCNPPYGERLSDRRACEELYAAMGRAFASLGTWQIYVLSSHEDFENFYGRKADKVRKLYNGMIKCNFYQYFKNGRRE